MGIIFDIRQRNALNADRRPPAAHMNLAAALWRRPINRFTLGTSAPPVRGLGPFLRESANSLSETTEPLPMQGFRLVGMAGFEPATS